MSKFSPNYIVLDLETGGFSPTKNAICEIGFITLAGETLEVIEKYSCYIEPNYGPYSYEQQALNSNGITMLQLGHKGIKAYDAYLKLKTTLQNLNKEKGWECKPILCGHKVRGFDMKFLEEFFKFHKDDFLKYINAGVILDTLYYSKMVWGHTVSDDAHFTLSDCCSKIGVQITDAHSALGDVVANVELVREILVRMRSTGGKTETSRDDFRSRKGYRF